MSTSFAERIVPGKTLVVGGPVTTNAYATGFVQNGQELRRQASDGNNDQYHGQLAQPEVIWHQDWH